MFVVVDFYREFVPTGSIGSIGSIAPSKKSKFFLFFLKKKRLNFQKNQCQCQLFNVSGVFFKKEKRKRRKQQKNKNKER